MTICLFFNTLHAQGLLKGQTINICDDEAEWPPYTYFKRTPSGKKTQQVVGFSVDLIHEIFDKEGIEFTIRLRPWARCLKKVETGKTYQMALNASYNKERAEKYYLSAPYYNTSNYYFYSKKNNPAGLDIKSLGDFKKYQVCGLLGYNYDPYGLPKGSIDQGAKKFPSLIAKLHAARCTLFFEKYEILAGFSVIGEKFLSDKNLGRAPIPGMSPANFYMIISKNYSHGQELKKIIDQGIARLKLSGKMDALLKKYIP